MRCSFQSYGLQISIHALREEGDQRLDFFFDACIISIHALREEGDRVSVCRTVTGHYISIHALREEGDRLRWDLPPDKRISIHALREEGDMLFRLSL